MIANRCSAGNGRRYPSAGVAGARSRTLLGMQVTSQCRVDAPVEWVRSFLLAGTSEDDVTVDGDVVEVRQHDRVLHLVVRNTLRADEDGGTLLDVDADLRLVGLARIVGGVFRGRVRRTLERSLDRLPTAIEQALAGEDQAAAQHTEKTAGDAPG
jgi:carbon monoxide dehydrogenase subunit G